jgi:hypothetical protein
MENEFTSFEIDLIGRELSRKSYSDIAFLIDKEISDVTSLARTHFPDLIPYQVLLDEKKAARPPVIRKPRPPKEKKPKIISRRIVQEQKVQRARRNEPKFATKVVDYSNMKSIRVDDRTYAYPKPGEDPEQCRERVLKLMKKNSALKPIESWYTKKKNRA